MPKTIDPVKKAYNPAIATVHTGTEREITMLFKDWKQRNNSA